MEYMSREDYCEENCGKENRKGYKTCTNCGMLNVPTADAQPVRHGRWTDHHCKHIEQLNANLIQAKCTYCGRYSDKIDAYCRYLDLEYCSHCGADMRKETNNG